MSNAETTTTLSEAASKQLLGRYGVPFAAERITPNASEAVKAANELGFPVVVKLNGDKIAHKTERGLVRLGLSNAEAVLAAGNELLAKSTPEDGDVDLLVAPMISGNRELIAGLATDPQFGTTIMVGIGGIFAEAVADVSLRLVPISPIDAEEMIDDLKTQALLGEFRGEAAIDREALAQVLLALSEAAVANPEIVSADLNPLIVSNGRPIAVDALVEMRS
ncbi:MAG: acetate--CoA ligase family protein [Acidimicrobiia bacterium]